MVGEWTGYNWFILGYAAMEFMAAIYDLYRWHPLSMGVNLGIAVSNVFFFLLTRKI